MNTQLKEIAKVWPNIQSVFSVPHNEKDHNNLVNLLDSLIDEVSNNESHPLSSLMETIGSLFVVVLLAWSITASADDSNFSTHLHSKFQTKGCTNCHDFFDKERGGLAFKSHKDRSPDTCIYCHAQDVTGFKHADEWFAQPGLYTSGMDSQQTCEAIKTALHANFKNKEMVARQLELHLFEDPRVLWGIEGATPSSGTLPGGEKEKDLVKEGSTKWKEQVGTWIQGGMKCQ